VLEMCLFGPVVGKCPKWQAICVLAELDVWETGLSLPDPRLVVGAMVGTQERQMPSTDKKASERPKFNECAEKVTFSCL
jgi:hypothetical protein